VELFITHIILILILLGFSAFFSGSEAALFSLSKAQTRRLRDASAAGRMVAGMLRYPRKLLITILLGNLFVNILSTSVVTSVSIAQFGERGVGYAFVVMSLVLITVGEIFP
jgi:putative hemolysin